MEYVQKYSIIMLEQSEVILFSKNTSITQLNFSQMGLSQEEQAYLRISLQYNQLLPVNRKYMFIHLFLRLETIINELF